MEPFLSILASLIAVAVVLSLHEFAHAFIAYKCGDPTAKMMGRMTINPVKHFDPTGLFLFVFARFGWAKPVPINPNNFKNRRLGSFWTAIAGILLNYLTAFLLFYPLALLTQNYISPIFAGKYMEYFLNVLTLYLYWYSISFCAFNFIPLYPLDGFRMWDALDRKHYRLLNYLRMYGAYILMGLIVMNVLAGAVPLLQYVNVLGFIMDRFSNLIAWPIARFWGWVFTF